MQCENVQRKRRGKPIENEWELVCTLTLSPSWVGARSYGVTAALEVLPLQKQFSDLLDRL